MRCFRAQPLTIGILALAAGATLGSTSTAAPASVELVYVGTHGALPPPDPTTPPEKATQGIYQMRLDLKTGALSIPTVAYELHHATWLTPNPRLPVVYAVAAAAGEQTDSQIYSFRVDKKNERLELMNNVASGGQDVTVISADAQTNTLFAAHFGSGTLSALSLNEDGSLGEVKSTQTETGSGPTARQKSAHPHDAVISPEHNFVLVPDFGADRIFTYRFNPATRALTPTKSPAQILPAGSGPRHLSFHPNGKYVFVNTELTAEVRSYRWQGRTGRLTPIQVVPAYPNGHTGEKVAAELALSQDGRFAYMSLRGDQDTIIVYYIDASKGTLTEIQRMSAGGRTPWSFGIDLTGRYMLVTNEGSNKVVVLSVDPESGRLSTTGQSVTVPRPVTVTFYAE